MLIGGTKHSAGLIALAATALAPTLAFAQETTAPVVDKGDTAWMLISTVLVLAMIIPGLALFYGGLVRAKNMVSILSQMFVVTAIGMVLWLFVGYSLAFTDGTWKSIYDSTLGKSGSPAEPPALDRY